MGGVGLQVDKGKGTGPLQLGIYKVLYIKICPLSIKSNNGLYG